MSNSFKRPMHVRANAFGEGVKEYQVIIDDGAIWVYNLKTNRYTAEHKLGKSAKTRICKQWGELV